MEDLEAIFQHELSKDEKQKARFDEFIESLKERSIRYVEEEKIYSILINKGLNLGLRILQGNTLFPYLSVEEKQRFLDYLNDKLALNMVKYMHK
ncbi:MAG: hypothetical protein ACRCX8_14210 [Sarcina sp.]